jgi:very-short-patch-repair endonuclease
MTYKYNRRLAYPFYFNMDPEMIGKARELRKNMTKAEHKLWQQLRRKVLMGARFRRQHPINKFIADFYCHEAKLIIEVDGPYHNDEEQQQNDKGRTYELQDMGIDIIRFTNEEVELNIEKVLEIIKEKLTSKIQVPP